MSWKDGFTARGSLGAAKFWVREARLKAGRRVQSHEYPLRDEPYNEDLGRASRRMSFDAYCLGLDYHVERNALVAEIEKPGALDLRHPYLGAKSVVVLDFSVRESTREGGFAAITIECIEEGKQAFPSIKPSTQVKVKTAADKTLKTSVDDFSKKFKLNDASNASDDFLGKVDDIFADSSDVVGDVSSPLSSLLTSPLKAGSSISGAVTNINTSVDNPLGAVSVLQGLFGAGKEPSVSNSSQRAEQSARNEHALNTLVRTSAVASAANATADIDLESKQDTPLPRERVLAIRDDMLDEIDSIQESVDPVSGDPIDDELYSDLAELRLAVTDDLSSRAGRLPSVRKHKPDASLPTLVIAHKLYGDASRESEIIALNNISHPGHVMGGEEIEVLSE